MSVITPTFKETIPEGYWISHPTSSITTVEPVKDAKELKIALIGTAPSSRLLAPFSDPSWTIWGCSPGNMNTLPRVDAWFEIHGNLLWDVHRHYGEPYLKWLAEQKFPVYMQKTKGFNALDYVPNAIPYPMDEMVKEFGPYFFTSSFAWMLAMAFKKGAKKVAMYGIDMASPGEYILQRPSFYHFLLEGKKRGVEITAPYESDLMQPPGLYGFSECTPRGRKILAREQEIDGRLNAMRQQLMTLQHQIHHLEGAREDNDYHKSIWIAEVSDPYGVAEAGETDG